MTSVKMRESKYINSLNALSVLENQLKCCICEQIARSPCTLGGCEHIFCSLCCDAYLGTNCPVCKIPAHVKDADVNRQLFTLASLCQQLKSVLGGGDHVNEAKYDNELQQTPNQSTPGTESHGHGQQTPGQSGSCLVSCDSHVTEGSTSDHVIQIEDIGHTPENKIVKKSKRKLRIKDNGTKTMDEMEVGVQVRESAGTNKNKGRNSKKAKKAIPVDQTTLTQFYEYDSDSAEMVDAAGLDQADKEDGRKVISSSETDVSKQNNGVKLPQSVHGVLEGVCNDKHDKISGTNIGTRKTENEGVSKPVTRLRRRSDGVIKENVPISKRKIDRQSLPASVPSSSVLDISPASTSKYPATKTKKAEKMISSKEAVSPAQHTPRNKPRRSRSNATPSSKVSMATPSPAVSMATPVTPATPLSARSRMLVTGSPTNPARSQGGNVSASPALNKRNAKGETPLQVAAIKNDVVKVRKLLEDGANPNVRDNAGWTPLHEACNHGYLEVARLLLDNGAMINVPGLDNDSPLHDAISNGRIDCVKLLVSRGASLTVRNLHGWTPQDFARTKSREMQNALKTTVTAELHSDSQVLDVLEYQQPCLLGTALSRDQKIVLQKCANVLQAKLVDDCTAELTHVVTSCNRAGMCPRTIKYLHGVLTGKWILNMEWVDTCLELRSRVLEEAFEVQGTSTCPDSQAPYKGRMNRKHQLPGLFDGCQFYFHGSFENSTPDKDDLVNLVKAGGGKILSREPKPGHIDDTNLTVPYHATANGLGTNCCIYIVHENSVKFTPIRTPVMCSLSASWVLDSAAQFKLLDLPVM